MAYKVFSNGDALTGGELNTFLMNQSVITFASEAARNAALPAPLEGQLVWLDDSNKYVSYNGSAWVDLIVPQSNSGNAVINGAFEIWQRGTSFTNPSSGAYNVDRWLLAYNGTGATRSVSQQAFTPGSAPVAGYESSFFVRNNLSAVGVLNTSNYFSTRIEDVRTFAGQTVTLSFWAKADAARTINSSLVRNYGTGGSSTDEDLGNTPHFLTTAWQRFSNTISLASLTGKTINANSFLQISFLLPAGVTNTVDIWGVQLESGSTATPFRRNANNIQGELAACQRYFVRYAGGAASFGYSTAPTTTFVGRFSLMVPSNPRSLPPTLQITGTPQLYDGTNVYNITAFGAPDSDNNYIWFQASVASGLIQFRSYTIYLNSGSLALSWEF